MNIPQAPSTQNVTFSVDQFPYVVATLSGKPGKKDYKAIADYFEKILELQHKTVLLTDMQPVTGLKLLETMTFWVPWATKYRKAIDDLSIASAYVNNNPVIVKILNAVIRALPVKSPLKVFADKKKAIQWLRKYADQENIKID